MKQESKLGGSKNQEGQTEGQGKGQNQNQDSGSSNEESQSPHVSKHSGDTASKAEANSMEVNTSDNVNDSSVTHNAHTEPAVIPGLPGLTVWTPNKLLPGFPPMQGYFNH